MIRKFDEWLFEVNKETATEFIEDLKRSLSKVGMTEGESYTITSSNAQLKNGTVELQIFDKNSLEEALKEWGIDKKQDLSVQDLENYMSYGSNGKSGALTVYSRGGVRSWRASSDSHKFTPDKEGVEKLAVWIKEWYTRSAIESFVHRVRPMNFYISKKGKLLNIKDFSSYMSTLVEEKLIWLEKHSPLALAELSPSIVFMCFLAKLSKDKIDWAGSSAGFNDVLDLIVKYDGNSVSFNAYSKWKVGKKEKTIENKLEHRWGAKGASNYSHDFNAIVKDGVFPERFKGILKEIQKGDYDIDKLTEKVKGVVTAKKFGM